ncbi:MAG: hypothetical protein JSS02_13630 [Planctomycetes bacterium]|nr:hypothetical protein [Planctomycetota bacterium]
MSDKQIVDAVRLILASQSRSGSGGPAGGSGSGVAEISVGDVLGEIVLHVVGAVPDIILEVVTEGVPDVDVVADVVGELVLDIGKEVIVHVIVDIIFDILAAPIHLKDLDSNGLRSALQQRVERAKRVVSLASPEQAAPSSRELADLRKAILKSRKAKLV